MCDDTNTRAISPDSSTDSNDRLLSHLSKDLLSDSSEFTVTCYRTGNILSTRTDNLDLSVVVTPESAPARIAQIFARFFYPIWILKLLFPLLDNLGTQTLTFDNLVLAYTPQSSWPPFDAHIFDDRQPPPKCNLTINHLTIVCTADTQDSALRIKDYLLKLFDKLAINCLDFVVKPLHVSLDSLYPVQDFIALFKDLPNIRCLSQDPAQDSLEYASPHIMFGSCSSSFFHHKFFCQHYQYQELYKDIDGDGILIATLGYGCNPNLNSNELPLIDDNWSFDRDIAPPVIYNSEAYTINWHIHEYTKSSRFVVCRTTDNRGIIANSINQENYGIGDGDHSLDLPIGSATAEAIKWLRKKWKQKSWKWTDKDGSKKWYNNLVILIPYGGQYREDEMIQITKATDEGIIIVCAAGDCHDAPNALPFLSGKFMHEAAWKGTKTPGNVVFPAALGTVISVGVAGIGPSGREIDLSVNFSKPANRYSLSSNCGVAAAKITGLLSLLLTSINKALENPPDDNCYEVVRLIKKKGIYMHTCVIRELLISEGNGSHDPQLGYGDGEEILQKLLSMERSTLIQKIANILIKRHQEFCRSEHQTIIKEHKRVRRMSMNGMNFTVAIIDKFANFEDINKSEGKSHNTTFVEFKETLISSHGEKCASIVKKYCPDATIQCANVCKGQEQRILPIDMAYAFEDCIDPDDANIEFDVEMQLPFFFDVISCSISLLSFDHNLCIAVNKAVMAGKIIVFAAGNMGLSQRNTIGYPGRIGNVIVIGGRDQYYNRAGFSSVGREMDFLAEGEQFGDGTSFAAPVVAGYIILILDFIRSKMKDMFIKAWSTYNAEKSDSPHREYNWRNIPVLQAAKNVYAMRAILKLLVPKPQDHSEREGFGCLDLTTLFPSYLNENEKVREFVHNEAKKLIYNALQNFYYAGQRLL